MNTFWKYGVRLVFLYVCWLGMLATNEFGHMIHGWCSGGRVVQTVLPWVGFSRTEVSPNPHPLIVAWGGAVWGSLVPLVLLSMSATTGFRLKWVQFFAGFCLIANGAYLFAGSFLSTGDAGDLLRHGAPHWLLVATGAIGAAAGLFLWHRLGPRRPTRPLESEVPNCDSMR